jgi:hypothetical protein
MLRVITELGEIVTPSPTTVGAQEGSAGKSRGGTQMSPGGLGGPGDHGRGARCAAN